MTLISQRQYCNPTAIHQISSLKSKIKANVLLLFHFQDQVIEALRRSKFKFPGRQKIFVSKNWGFTKWNREQYAEMKADGRLKHDGVNVKYVSIFNVCICIIYYYYQVYPRTRSSQGLVQDPGRLGWS